MHHSRWCQRPNSCFKHQHLTWPMTHALAPWITSYDFKRHTRWTWNEGTSYTTWVSPAALVQRWPGSVPLGIHPKLTIVIIFLTQGFPNTSSATFPNRKTSSGGLRPQRPAQQVFGHPPPRGSILPHQPSPYQSFSFTCWWCCDSLSCWIRARWLRFWGSLNQVLE